MPSYHDELIGTWRSVSITMSNASETIHPFGEDVKGYLVYSPDGYMSAHVTSSEAMIPYAAGFNSPTADEALFYARHTNGYTGRYYVHEEGSRKATVYHEIQISNPPNFVGGIQKRNQEIWEDDQGRLRLTITVDEKVKLAKGEGVLTLQWVKVDVHDVSVTVPQQYEKIGDR